MNATIACKSLVLRNYILEPLNIVLNEWLKKNDDDYDEVKKSQQNAVGICNFVSEHKKKKNRKITVKLQLQPHIITNTHTHTQR